MPFGAAALTKKIENAGPVGSHGFKKFQEEVVGDLKGAVRDIEIPEQLLRQEGGLTLYLSGGGFRGWVSSTGIQIFDVLIIACRDSF